MTERPILFSAPMVRRLLDGSKTQTRRIVKPPPPIEGGYPVEVHPGGLSQKILGGVYSIPLRCPYGKPGDRLWVRETWVGPMFTGEPPLDWMSSKYNTPEYCHYRASGDSCEFFDLSQDRTVQRWIPSIHMPRWASRITLEVTGVRVERLQEIDEAGAVAEGMAPRTVSAFRVEARADFCALWSTINGPDSWDANPWVWVIEFKRVA